MLALLTIAMLPGCDLRKQESTTKVVGATEAASTDAGAPAPAKAEEVPAPAAPEPAPAVAEQPRVRLETSLGAIVIELNPKAAPVTVANFLKYVNDGFYAGTVFHRVIDGFMIQGGGMELKNGQLAEKPTGAPIANEAANGLKNDRGTIAMARTNNPNSATAQFFINVVDNAGLNRPNPDGHGYAVFGRVVEGMETVDKIKSVATGGMDIPNEPVVIKSASVVK